MRAPRIPSAAMQGRLPSKASRALFTSTASLGKLPCRARAMFSPKACDWASPARFAFGVDAQLPFPLDAAHQVALFVDQNSGGAIKLMQIFGHLRAFCVRLAAADRDLDFPGCGRNRSRQITDRGSGAMLVASRS